MLFGNLDKKTSLNESINEGNFIAANAVFGVFDTAADSKLNKLTLGKLFEGLDLDSSIHDHLSSNVPSISELIGQDKEDSTTASDILKAQLAYIQKRCDTIESDFESALKAVLAATETKDIKNPADATDEKIQAIAGPEGISSIMTKINELVKKYKESGGTLTSPEMKSAFNALNRINTGKIVSDVSNSLMESGSSVNLVSAYKRIDAMEIESLDAENAISNPVIYAGKSFSTDEMLKSNDPVARLAAFYEIIISAYPFGRKMASNFGTDYSNIGSGIAMASLKQFVPSIDSSAFSKVAVLLDDICTTLVNRVVELSPEEDARNIIVPSLQAMLVGMVAIVAMKLINYNLSVDAVLAKKTEDVKASSAQSQKERAMNLKNAYDTLDQTGFFDDGAIYWAKSGKMKPEHIKNVNYFFNSLGLLSDDVIGNETFGEQLTLAIEKFQRQSKLAQVDGKIGPKTRAAMEATAKYISQKYDVV